MNFLLDTHVILWWFVNSDRLSPRVVSLISNPDSKIYVSSASFWEIGIKRKLGRLEIETGELLFAVKASRFNELPISIVHALKAGDLPRHHDDPFDRMLIAQAISDNLHLITHDRKLLQYDVPTVYL